jgi:hypothetical protein
MQSPQNGQRLPGIALLTLAFLGSLLLSTVEMGEFSRFRRPVQIALPIGDFMVMCYVGELVHPRALFSLSALRRAVAGSRVPPE